MLKKYLIVAVCFVVILCSALSVSAETYSFGDFEVKSVDFFLIRDDEWMNGGTVSYTSLDGGLRLRVELSSDFGTPQKGDRFSLFVECAPTDGAYINSQQNVTGDVRLGVKSPPNDLNEDSTDTYAYRWDTSQNHEQYARNVFWSSDWGEYCTFKFEDSSLGYSFNRYIFCCEWEITSSSELSTYARYVYLSNAEFEFQSQSDYEADKITQNQDENTDKILNGGKDYSNPDDTTINDYAGADAELNSQIESSRQESISFLNSFGNTFAGSKLSRGLLFVTSLFNEFIKIDWISEILFFALSLGAFAFVIGASVLVIGRVRQASHRASIEKYHSEGLSKRGKK